MNDKPTYQDLERALDKLKESYNKLHKENADLKKEVAKNSMNAVSSHQPSEQYLLNILMQTIPDRIYFKDAQSQFIRINKSLAELHGISNPDYAIGRTDFDFFTKEHARQAFNDEQNILATGKPLKNIEERETWNNGTITWASTTKMPLIDDKGNRIGTFGISRDITQQKETQQAIKDSEEQLRELNATKDKFFSIIAHDLMSPICTLVGFSQLLTKNIDTYSIQKIKETTTLIDGIVKNTFDLLENLLLWSRTQTKSTELKTKKENLLEMTKETILLHNQTALKKSIRLTTKINDDIFVEVEKNMILTVLRNLVSNAIKFTSSGGEITIEIGQLVNYGKQNFLEVSVNDTGIGIPKEKINKLFKIAENVSTKGTENESGTGLGLPLCKEFIDKHKGKIWVESEEGKGSKFIFTLPI
jgi:PAS domain S-box-containing protein